MTTTLLAPSMRLANEAIAKRIVAKVRDHSPAPGLLTLDRWELAETEIRLALDAAGRDICPSQGVVRSDPQAVTPLTPAAGAGAATAKAERPAATFSTARRSRL